MKPENQKESSDMAEEVPPELIDALTRLRGREMKVSPTVDASLMHSAREHLGGIRAGKQPPIARWLLWPTAAAACFLLAWIAFRPTSPMNVTSPRQVVHKEDAAVVILREFSALFPNQINAIIRDSGGIQLSLSDKPYISTGQAFVIKVCEPRGCEEIITFSGRNIEVAGHSVTVSTHGRDRVMLDGKNFLWSSDTNGNPAPGIHIESRGL